MKLFMMPHTVPNRPTNGATAPTVARIPMPRPMRRTAAASIRSNCQATRSLIPSAARPRDFSISSSATASSRPIAPYGCSICRTASTSERTERTVASARRASRCAVRNWIILTREYGPGCHRGQRETDHDRLHDDVRLHEHARGRQGIGQRGDDYRPIRRGRSARRRWGNGGSGRCRLSLRRGWGRRGSTGRGACICGERWLVLMRRGAFLPDGCHLLPEPVVAPERRRRQGQPRQSATLESAPLSALVLPAVGSEPST